MKLVSSSIPFGDSLEVEAVINHTGAIGSRKYLVKWKGLPTEENSWEPVSNFEDLACIAKFWKYQGEKAVSQDKIFLKSPKLYISTHLPQSIHPTRLRPPTTTGLTLKNRFGNV
jgi:hypothetical protein